MSTCLAQSSASRFKRNVLHVVGQPERRTAAFYLPAAVLAIIAMRIIALIDDASVIERLLKDLSVWDPQP